jgi:hypothetical protein
MPRFSSCVPLFVRGLFALAFLVCAQVPRVAAEAAAEAAHNEYLDAGEYDAILSLDDAQLSQRIDGWHGGIAVDNALPDEEGAANVGVDMRYQTSAYEFSSRLQVVDRDVYRARLQYSQAFFTTAATRWRGVVSAGYENDALKDAEFSADFEDHDTDAALALVFEHDFDVAFISSQLQMRRQRFERRGDGLALGQPAELDVEKDFRLLAWNLAAQWQFDAIDQSVWLQATRVTDRDVSVCVDELCFAADAAEETFTLYDVQFDQQWYLTARHRDGVSWLTRLAGYGASVDHLPVNYQFSLGGMYSVRGYDDAIAGGDEMALLRNELRLPWNASSAWLTLGARQYAYLFYDWGMVWQHAVDTVINARTFELLPETSTRLSAAGVGIDLAIAHDISLRLEYAVVQSAIDGLVDTGDTRIHASLDWRAF